MNEILTTEDLDFAGNKAQTLQDYDQCPFCSRLVAFYAYDSHVKRCREREAGERHG